MNTDKKRMRYLLGDILLLEMGFDESLKETVLAILDARLLHSKDRKLFGLPMLPEQQDIDARVCHGRRRCIRK